MQTTNRSTRDKAIDWWNGLKTNERERMGLNHLKTAIDTDWVNYEMVEKIYLSEHPTPTPLPTGKEDKEDDEIRMAYQSADMQDYENKTGTYAPTGKDAGEDKLDRGIYNACILALEFGYTQCEKGNNIQMAILNYNKIVNP